MLAELFREFEDAFAVVVFGNVNLSAFELSFHLSVGDCVSTAVLFGWMYGK
ncbi:hypothetical protein C7S17_6649 [Burkholderia thailandensis]|nr:hypothetical protein [Burkholderia thailandensis]